MESGEVFGIWEGRKFAGGPGWVNGGYEEPRSCLMPRILGAREPIGGALVRSIDTKAWPAPVYLRQADRDDVEDGRLARPMAVLPVERRLEPI